MWSIWISTTAECSRSSIHWRTPIWYVEGIQENDGSSKLQCDLVLWSDYPESCNDRQQKIRCTQTSSPVKCQHFGISRQNSERARNLASRIQAMRIRRSTPFSARDKEVEIHHRFIVSCCWSVVFDCYKSLNRPAIHCHPDRTPQMELAMVGFVDDNKGQTNTFLHAESNNTLPTMLWHIRHNAQAW